jgi:hypothetical protein
MIKRCTFEDTVDVSSVDGLFWDQKITYTFEEESKSDGDVWIEGSLPSVLRLNDARSLYMGLDVKTFAVQGPKGELKNGEATIEVGRLDEVFLGGPDLHMKLERSGGVEVYGEATHAVVNGRVGWRAMGHLIPSEVWAATIGAVVSFVLSMALLGWRSLVGDSKH